LRRKNYDRKIPTHNYLKYWRVIRYWAKAKYGLTTPDLDMMFFLYSEDYFNKTKFKDFEQIMSWDVTGLPVNGIVAATTERVTAENPSDGQIHTIPGAMSFYGVSSIVRTGRHEAATWRKERRNQELINSNQEEKKTRAQTLQGILHCGNGVITAFC
jgi:hypothetical protein